MNNDLIELEKTSKKLALSEAEKYELPSIFHVELAHSVGQRLAQQLGADAQIVSIGTYLMDCMLGYASSQGKLTEHVAMGVERVHKLLDELGSINDVVRRNIVACVQEHHGVPTFSTLEAEICCNADCYRFASVEGFIGGIHNSKKMEMVTLVSLYNAKADEKWNALSLAVCKEELRPQYEVIKELLGAVS